ncbi:hypothetical protein HDU83_002821, partial [Entophlyctis luteolus]
DFMGDFEANQATCRENLQGSMVKMILLGVGISLFFVAASVPATHFILGRPLKHLTEVMGQMAKLDFGALEEVSRRQRSNIKERGGVELESGYIQSRIANHKFTIEQSEN